MHPTPAHPAAPRPTSLTRAHAVGRLLAVAAAATGVVVVLWALPWPDLPSRPDQVPAWWESVGTAGAAVAILRGATLLAAVWVLAVALFGAGVLAARWRPGVELWRSVSPAPIRRLAVASAVLGASLPGVAVAADATNGGPPVIRDLGPAEVDSGPVPLLHDLGPASEPTTRAPANAPATAAPDAGRREVDRPGSDTREIGEVAGERWIVEPGDHLWAIAEATLADRGGPSGEAEIAVYWREVIAVNRATIGPDPDLIHPGTVLTLP